MGQTYSEALKKFFFTKLDNHLKKSFIHFRYSEEAPNGKTRIVFCSQNFFWKTILVEGIEFFFKAGQKAYFKRIDDIIKSKLTRLPKFEQNIDNVEIVQTQEDLPIVGYIKRDPLLEKLNSRRKRNFIIYTNNSRQIVYDSITKKLMFSQKAPFSDIEHDTNRKYTQEVCVDILFDFEKNKEKFIKMLSKPKYAKEFIPAYKKYVEILNGNAIFTDEDILVMISILGRLNEESQRGPIEVQREMKMNPENVAKHVTLQKYIISYVSTIKEYSVQYLSNKDELKQLGNLSFDGKLDRSEIKPNPIPLLAYNGKQKFQVQIIQPKIVGNEYSPNYIESFFRKVTDLPEFEQLPILSDDFKDILVELANFAQRYQGNTKPDFIILSKMKTILSYKPFGSLMRLINKEILEVSSKQTYYRKVAEKLISLKDEREQKEEFYKLLSIYEDFIASEMKRFVSSKKDNVNSDFNDDEVSISSDMHFNDLKDIAKENFSKNFNIIAGDFFNNSYHRAGAKVTDISDITGIGVLGNHDVDWVDSSEDISKQVRTRYRKSISTLNKIFPNVKILNNEVFYKNGIAFVGLTMVTDEDSKGKRSFFGNTALGKLFSTEKYIEKAKKLLDSIDPHTPIVVISHSPFKEYAVCQNKEIGIRSNNIFSQYPNVRVYIHGHGHSKQNTQYINNVLCITNPIVRNIYSDSILSYQWKDFSNKKTNDSIFRI